MSSLTPIRTITGPAGPPLPPKPPIPGQQEPYGMFGNYIEGPHPPFPQPEQTEWQDPPISGQRGQQIGGGLYHNHMDDHHAPGYTREPHPHFNANPEHRDGPPPYQPPAPDVQGATSRKSQPAAGSQG
ncbi:hypothetical protein PAXINDRAFT_6537 [Paxillus involutus ATCC 200175]|nr:hypothetical protein PAXINDRAFT_6537 [Paxillus involutus ATCC 200175]